MKKEDYNGRVVIAAIIIIVLGSLLLMCSCKQTEQLTKTDTVFITRTDIEYLTKIDSVTVEVFRDRWQKGDTVYITKDSTVYRYAFRSDTVNKVDTVYLTKEVTKTIHDKKKTKRPLLLMLIGAAIPVAIWIVSRTNSAQHN